MFSSLRSRLWWTNAVLIGIVLGVAGLMMIVFVRGIPVRTTEIRLREVSNLIVQSEQPPLSQIFRQEGALANLAMRFQVRILLVAADGNVLLDTAEGERPALRRINISRLTVQGGAFPVTGTTRDGENRIWQFSLQPVTENRYLLLAAQRPSFQWLTIFTDDLLPPLLAAAGLAVLLAIILSWLTARGISRPLRDIAEAARGIPQGDYRPIAVSGPSEVRQLADSFNRMIDKVRASRQSQRDFVANVSHELKTPLTSIHGFAQAMLDGTITDRQGLEKAAGVIYDESGRMHRLVVELLELARLEGGAAKFRREQVDVSLLLEKIAAQFSPQAQEAGIELRTSIQALPRLLGDGDRLAQVFTNLVDNGLKNTPAGGWLEISSLARDGFAEISVADSGPGIPAAELDRIFERFYQVDKSRARTGQQGTGLGLSIAREITEAHGGSIQADSRPGAGSVFVVKIPFMHTEALESGPKSD
jgi:signal transduction histidine kinase